MKTILVWYLVTFSYGTHYSPPMATLEECMKVRELVSPEYFARSLKCIQINEVVK